MNIFKKLYLFFLFCTSQVFAQRDDNNNYIDSLQNWSFHFQSTVVLQGHSAFKGAGYNGKNTLSALGDTALSVTSTFFVGRRLWQGAAFYVNPEIAGGRGLGHRDALSPYDESLYNSAVGVAGFPNGETFRIGSPKPSLYLARCYLEQIIPLDDNESFTDVLSEANQVKQRLPQSRMVFTVGKFSLADMLDNNSYSHDPRSHFMNWSLMSYGAWDYAANTRGYTWAVATEYIRPNYAVRLVGALMPLYANGNVLDWRINKGGSLNLELEKDFRLMKLPGKIKLLAYRNATKAPTYQVAIQQLQNNTYDFSHPLIIYGQNYGGVKYGFGLNFEQAFSATSGIFGRLSWNDGKTATWAFTQIDRSYSIGTNIGGTHWKRPNDVIGAAIVQNDISSDQRAFLNAGGYGFIVGDGSLPHYAGERILEVFYKAGVAKTLFLTGDYQLIANPGYNADRGPVSCFSVRMHVEF